MEYPLIIYFLYNTDLYIKKNRNGEMDQPNSFKSD